MRMRTRMGCPDCTGTLYIVEPEGCLFNFLLYVLMGGIPLAFGIVAHALSPGFNRWDWMFRSFPGAT